MEVSYDDTRKQRASHTSDNINCCQCYEKSLNGREKTSRSKLPRVVKTNSTGFGNRCYKPSESRVNNSGEVRPGPSSLQASPGCDGEKYKPSQIPRRRSNAREAPIRSSVIPNKKFISKPPFKTQARNVQRIQVLNTLQDFYSEKRPITTSIATSRPIPTLGQIYRRTEDTNRVADWLLERDNSYLHAPTSAVGREQDHISEVSTAGDATQNDVITDIIIEKKSAVKPVPEPQEPAPSSTNNWLSIHEHPTRDNESGYCSMSLGPRVPKYMNSKHSDVIPIVKQSEKKHYIAISETQSSVQSMSSNDGNSTGMILSEQQTVLLAEKPQGLDQTVLAAKIISRHKPSMALSQNSQSAFTKGMQFPSDGTFAKSYVECPSEVFQKTTDFETAGYASSSSIAATDLEYREYFSQSTLENVDGNSMAEDTHQWSSTGTKSMNSICCDREEDQALLQQTDDLSIKCGAGQISTGTYRHYSNCCMLKRDRCKRLHGRSFFGRHYNYKDRIMAISSNKFKERRQSDMPRKRLSFRRMCQRRWNAVCQKTAERFINRPKSSMKIMKIRMMYAHPELFLEDVNVQTTGTTCIDTGIGTVNQNRSAGIATSMKWVSPNVHFMDAATSGTIPVNKKPLPKYADFGPSMFPWQFSTCSKRKITTPQNSENLSNVSKKRRQSRSTPNYRPIEFRKTRSIKSLQGPINLRKDESSPTIIIRDSTASVSKEIQAEPSSPLHEVESQTTIIISTSPYNIPLIKKDQATDPDKNDIKKPIISSINDSEVVKISTMTENKLLIEDPVIGASENALVNNEAPTYKNFILTGAGTKDFLHGKNDELIKSLQYSDLIYLERPYTNNMIACNPAEVNVSFNTPSKCCQTGTSCMMHNLCDRSTNVGFKLSHLDKKEASTETLSPLRHLGYQGPKIMSISSAFMPSPSVDTIRRDTRSTGNSAKTIVLKDIQILTSSLMRHRPSRLVSCGTETLDYIEAQSKTTSVEHFVLFSDTGTNAVQMKSKKSFNSGSGSLEISKINVSPAKHYVPASINTDTSKSISLGVSMNTSKSSSMGVSKKSSRPTALIDVCVQHNNLNEKPLKAYRSAAIVCSKVPSICKTEVGTSTTELTAAQCQEIATSEEMTASIGDYDSGTPKSGASSKMNANKWIKKCLASMEKDQITTILRQRSKSDKARTEKKSAKKASQFTLSSSQDVSPLEVSPFSGTVKKPDVPVAAMACITCLKPQASTPLLSTDVSEELMSKLMTEERTRSLLLKPTPFSAVLNASDVLRMKELKGTPAKTALSSVQNAEMQLCGEKKSKNVFTSRYQLAPPVPCRVDSCQPHSPDCKFVYGRPRCVVHQSCTDATGQMLAPHQDIVFTPNGVDAKTSPYSIAVATDTAPAQQTTQNAKPARLPQVLEVTDKCTKKSQHCATMSVVNFSLDLNTCEQNADVAETVPQVLAVTSTERSPPLNVKFFAAPPPTPHNREQNTEEFSFQDATIAKCSPHSVAVSTVDATPTRLTREQNTEFTEEFNLQVLGATKKPDYHTVKFSTAASPPARLDREQNTELTEEFLSQVPGIIRTKESTHQGVAIATDGGGALDRVTRSANTKLIGDVFFPQNCIELLVCDPLAEDATPTFPSNCPPVIWFSRNRPVHFHDCNLMSSCRYYSKLLTEQITRVKENLAKHLTPSEEKLADHETQADLQKFREVCTMKPSGRTEFACQTHVHRVPNIRQIKAMSCCTLSHAFSVTDICRGHETDLKTVYYLLSAIEGRIRRMKRNL